MRSFESHDLPVDSISLSHPTKDSSQYLKLSLQVFPLNQDNFNRTGTLSIGFLLSSQGFVPPKSFGPLFYFVADTYEHFGKYMFFHAVLIMIRDDQNIHVQWGPAQFTNLGLGMGILLGLWLRMGSLVFNDMSIWWRGLCVVLGFMV